MRAARLPRVDRGPRHPRHAHRSRAAQVRGRQPTGHAGATLARAAASAGGRHGRHAVRDDRRGRPGLRRHRGRNGPADRRSLGGREDGHPVRLRRLLPDRSAIATPRATPIAAMPGQTPAPATADNRELWARDAERFNDLFGAALNSHRASLGLAPVSDVRSHIFTDRPWLAADPTLAPWPDPADQAVFQTGAWILPDERPLSPELETFLDAGEPPVYFGFGSMRAPQDLSQVMIQTARALGRRAIVSRGWADLSLVDNEPDCLAIGEVNQQALFKRVAAVVHHGGAGTTTAAALAGAPQVVIPQMLRPALLGATSPPPRHRNRARTRHADHRLADERSRAHPPARCGCPCPIHRHRGAHATAHRSPPSA